jgi:hypothetical protein
MFRVSKRKELEYKHGRRNMGSKLSILILTEGGIL